MPIDAYARSGWPGMPGGSAGFSRNASIVRPSAAAWITPNAVASSRGTGIAATVTPAPRRDVLLDHLPRVHPEHVVRAEHGDDVG